jgi:hypothetical protein
MRVHQTAGILSLAITTTRVHRGETEGSRPEHDVTEGIIMLGDDIRSEATRLIGLG